MVALKLRDVFTIRAELKYAAGLRDKWTRREAMLRRELSAREAELPPIASTRRKGTGR